METIKLERLAGWGEQAARSIPITGTVSGRKTAKQLSAAMAQVRSLSLSESASAWYAEAVSWAASNGLVNGMGDGTFAPNNSITREQMVVILYRYTEAYQARDLSAREELSAFGDGSDVSGYAREAVSWAVASDILHGKGNGALAPRGTATRAEVAQLFANYLQAAPAPGDGEFVRVREYIPDIQVELMYATDRNFTGQVIYDFEDAWLRYGTVKKLAAVQDSLRAQGLGLKIWDAFRPVSAQFRLWEIVPDARYVANPYGGYSSHSRGNTVDVTLVYSGGGEFSMPTGFDDFTELADRDYSDVWDENAVENALLLENVMTEAGFSPYYGEWWHFSDTDDYEAADWFEPPA